jgi:SAGA-associated factor 11
MASHKKAAVAEDELLQRRIAHSKRLLALFHNPASLASQTVAAYSYLLDECLMDVAIEVQRDAKLEPQAWDGSNSCEPELTETDHHHDAPINNNVDVFGQAHNAIALEVVECLNCGRKLAAGRYAPHLEKCLGRGRTSARATSRRQSKDSKARPTGSPDDCPSLR